MKMCEHPWGIHARKDNLKSDKRLSWMCLECDIGFFGVHLRCRSAYSYEKPLENLENRCMNALSKVHG